MKDKNMEVENNLSETYSPRNESSTMDNVLFYGVFIPSDHYAAVNSSHNVFQNKMSVIQLMKQNKRARFKVFDNYEQALEFARNGSEISMDEWDSIQKSNTDIPSLVGEKPSPFKGPKPQDLVVLRKAIERGDYKTVRHTIWSNPRYLISNGDTPSILQEGCRYNALHIAAKAKNSQITELLLNTVSNVEFVKLLYGDDNQENSEDRAKAFLDLYLNTPDKGFNETPLHFAVKLGAVEVVEVLVSYPQCDRNIKNKYGKTPNMIICDRCDKSDVTLQRRIQQLLEEYYYVPVYRAEDNSMPPKIGEPFSPVNPPVFDNHPTSPRMEIQAFAGPMNKQGAENFRKIWKTPPRSLKLNTPNLSLDNSFESVASLKYKDPIKGLELVGKNLASQMDVSWKEYWDFLGSFVDITSQEGLEMLESHLKTKLLEISRSFSSPKTEKSKLNLSSISELCHAFQACHLNDSSDVIQDDSNSNNFSPFLCLEKACQVFANRFANNILNAVNGNLLNVLHSEVKQLEIVILSYMDDNRFSNINFNCTHDRLSCLISQKLTSKLRDDFEVHHIYDKLKATIEVCKKTYDCFSSDDESPSTKDVAKKGTSIKKQLLCLVHSILNDFNQNSKQHCDTITEKDCVNIWETLIPCCCVLYARKLKKNSSLQRSNSKKNSLGRPLDVVKRLFHDESDGTTAEQFYTPPGTPEVSDSESDFEDAESVYDYDNYIEGKAPCRTDAAVFNALKYSDCDINKESYPNVYLWKHNVGLFSDEERNSWKKENNCTLDDTKINYPVSSTPSKSWLRVTGVNSPKGVKRLGVPNGL